MNARSDYDGSKGIRNLILENYEFLCWYHPDSDPDKLFETFEGMLDEMLKRHAHELADQQREWADTFGDTPTQQSVRRVVHEAADRIDPKEDE